MTWKDIGDFVKKGAPLLGTALVGPAGGAMGGLVASLFGGEADDPAKVMSLMQSDPEALTKLKELELKHRERLEELSIEAARVQLEESKAYLADTQSARQRETAIVQATSKKDINLYILAWVVVGGFFLLTGLMMLIPELEGRSNNAMVNIMFGGLVSGFATVLGYFFGSSKGSTDKTQLLAANGRK
jgi:hypothetical protein